MNLTVLQGGQPIASSEIRVAEYEPLWIELTTPTDINIPPDVLLDGASIGKPEVSIIQGNLSWRWLFRSESWCGRATLSVISDSVSRDLNIIAVPSGSKYSEHEYERMIDWLLGCAANLPWGMAPGKAAASASAQDKISATHPALFDCYLLPLLEQLERIIREPALNQRPEQITDYFRPNRPASPSTVAWLASRPERLHHIRAGDLRVIVPQHIRRESFDHPANRFVLSLALRLIVAFERTVEALDRYSRGQLVGDLESLHARSLAQQVLGGIARIREALAKSTFRELTPGEMTESVAQIFGDHPAYGRFARLARRLLNDGVQLDSLGDLASSMRRSWDLFEIYSLYVLMEALETCLGDDWAFVRTPLSSHILCSPAEGKVWSAKRPDGQEWALFYQQRFDQGTPPAETITTRRRPDFILATYRADALSHWILLDAKYRTAEISIREAFESMHVYRDSLLWRCGKTGNAQKASAGYLLVPAIAPALDRFGTEEYLRSHQFGLIAIDNPHLSRFLVESSEPIESAL